jgi:o-succinylbenzoate synthase
VRGFPPVKQRVRSQRRKEEGFTINLVKLSLFLFLCELCVSVVCKKDSYLLINKMPRYQFEFRPYQRKFVRPLQTNHGTWETREGIIIRLTDDSGKVGWGEIAPISWFGSETFIQAIDFCHQLPNEITSEIIFSIPDNLPACQFGFESAGEGEWGVENGEVSNISPPTCPTSTTPSTPPYSLQFSALLPAGKAALETWESLWQRGYRTFKWKIGVYPIAEELAILDLLVQTLPSSAKLRFDANGGLSYDEAKLWLRTCDELQLLAGTPVIEFIEQPLGIEDFEAMFGLCGYMTKIALDESIATLAQLETFYQQGWQGIYVIKPAIIGSPTRLRSFCQQHQIDAVFSSVFETGIGRQSAIKLAFELSHHNRAIGFGVNHWFADDEETWLKNLW